MKNQMPDKMPDEKDIALDHELTKFGLALMDIAAMSEDDKRQMLSVFQESEQTEHANQERRRAFCKEADICLEELDVAGKLSYSGTEDKRSREVPGSQDLFFDSDATQDPEDDVKTVGANSDDDIKTFGANADDDNTETSDARLGDGRCHQPTESQGGKCDGDHGKLAAEIQPEVDEEETQPYEHDVILGSFLVKKRSHEVEDDDDEALTKKPRIESEDANQLRFHFEYEENEGLQPLSPIPAKLVNKRLAKLQKSKKLKRLYRMYAPSKQSSIEYTEKITQHFDEYFLALREAQACSPNLLAWADPVCEGKHSPGSLDVCRNVSKFMCDLDDEENLPDLVVEQKMSSNTTIEDAFSFDDILNEPKSTNSRAERYKRRNRIKYGEFEDIIEADDEDKDPDFTIERKSLPKRRQYRGRGLGRRRRNSKTLVKVDKESAQQQVIDDLWRLDTNVLPNLDAAVGGTHSTSDSDDSFELDGFAMRRVETNAECGEITQGQNEELDSVSLISQNDVTNIVSEDAVKSDCVYGNGAVKRKLPKDTGDDAGFTQMDKTRSPSPVFCASLKLEGEMAGNDSHENDSVKNVRIPSEKLTISSKAAQHIRSIYEAASQSQEGNIQDSNVLSPGPSPTEIQKSDDDFDTEEVRSSTKSVDDAHTSRFDVQTPDQEQIGDDDEQMTKKEEGLTDFSGANIGSISKSNGRRKKTLHKWSAVIVSDASVVTGNEELLGKEMHQTVLQREQSSGSVPEEKTGRVECIKPGVLRRRTQRRGQPSQKKRKIEDAINNPSKKDDESSQMPELNVICPLCVEPFPPNQIEMHASQCNGKVEFERRQTRSACSSQDDQKGRPEPPLTRKRLANSSQRCDDDSSITSDDDRELVDSGHPSALSPRAQDMQDRTVSEELDHGPAEDPFDKAKKVSVRSSRIKRRPEDEEVCFICDGSFRKGDELSEHVEECMRAQKDEQLRIMHSIQKAADHSRDNSNGGVEVQHVE